jgi:hypothetical protein
MIIPLFGSVNRKAEQGRTYPAFRKYGSRSLLIPVAARNVCTTVICAELRARFHIQFEGLVTRDLGSMEPETSGDRRSPLELAVLLANQNCIGPSDKAIRARGDMDHDL